MTKILVIEDEVILRKEMVEWLRLEGYETLAAENGLTGIEYALRNPPDLIVCDITMPYLDGYGVLLELRTQHVTAGIPFIFVTARAAHEDVRQGMTLGADDYITKPFTRLEFLQALQTRLGKKAAQEREHQFEVEQWRRSLKQEHEQRMLKAKLVAMFSHDFRTPLTTIQISNSLLRSYAGRMDEAQRLVHFNRVDAAVHRLLQMLDDILIVSQMETGNLGFKPESLNIDKFLQGIVEEFQALYGDTHRILYESRFAESFMTDPRLLRQIAANLISNAIKYSPQKGEVHVTLDRQDGQCLLTIQDNGIGIPKEDQPYLFEAFQRGSNVTNVSGTGLGLAIVKQAVDLHGGSVCFESQEGYGTTMMVTLPTLSSDRQLPSP